LPTSMEGRFPGRMNTAGSPTSAPVAVPAFADVQAAWDRITRYLRPTPLRASHLLSRMLDAQVWVKHENLQPTGAFKVRGGLNLMSQLSDDERARGVIAASSGNHGLSIAYAARQFGVHATVCVPAAANPVKVQGVRDAGADVIAHGADVDEAREHCEKLARAHGFRYVHSWNEPLLIAGVATLTLEILKECPDLDAIVVPVGGGSAAAGACLVVAAMGVRTDVIGVQSQQSPAGYESWRSASLVSAPNRTRHDGLATGAAYDLPQQVFRLLLSDFVVVSDQEITSAIWPMMQGTRTLVEGAGAAPLAAALRLRADLTGKRVCLVCTGANISADLLCEAACGR
jgi:threonine dehydratase